MKKIILLTVMVLMVSLAATGCAKKGALIKEPGTTEGTAATATEVTEKSPTQVARLGREDITGKYVEDPDAVAKLGIKVSDIFFDYDMYNIKDDAKPGLKELASWLMKNDAKVIIEGHCDERGTNEYNLGLGDRRANSAKQYLVASGVSPSKVETMSYGEEKPQCAEQNEGCWSKNRRAHFVILLPK